MCQFIHHISSTATISSDLFNNYEAVSHTIISTLMYSRTNRSLMSWLKLTLIYQFCYLKLILIISIIVIITLIPTVPPLTKIRFLPHRFLMKASTERSPQSSMLFLRDIVFTLRFGNSLSFCLGLFILSNISKRKIPRTKSLPVKSLKGDDAMKISSNLIKVKRFC